MSDFFLIKFQSNWFLAENKIPVIPEITAEF